MRHWPAYLAALVALPGLAQATTPVPSEVRIEVPSGQEIRLIETIWNAAGPAGLTLRYRFLAPQIGRGAGQIGFETAEADMMFLCETVALRGLSNIGPQVTQIIISLSDRVVPFGDADPEATQYFEAYRPENGACIWEGF